MKNSSKNTPNPAKDVPAFFLILAACFGLYVRLFPLVKADFPLVDGGMFYAMIRDLQAAHYILPAFTSYNFADIPFAYPPFPFYVAGLLNSVAGIPLLDIIQWIPLVATVLMIPCFYYLAKAMLYSDTRATLATLIFTLTPNSYWWNIAGGGLTRSMGMLFFVFTALCAHRMYRERKPIWVVGSAIGGALVASSHLQWALQAAVVIFLMWMIWGRDRQGVLYSAFVGIGVLLLTSPWWVAVLQHHGLDVFLLAGQVTHSRWQFWTIFFALSFTGEYTPIIAVFALVGLFIHLARRDYFLPLWAILCLFVDPRGGMPASIIPFSIMAMTAIVDGIALQLSNSNSSGSSSDLWADSLYTQPGRLFFGFFVILFLYNAYNISDTLSRQVVGTEELNAIDWVKSNTKTTDRFLILDEQGNPLLSPLTEWFPALAERRSIATIQGTEWLAGDRHYNQRHLLITEIHQCLYRDAECLGQMAGEFDFLVVSSKNPVPLLYSLENRPDFVPVYSSPQIKIFRVGENQ